MDGLTNLFNENMQSAFTAFVSMVGYAVPFSAVFGIGNLILDTFLRVAFSGRLYFGRGRS